MNNTIYLVDDSKVIRQIVAHLLKDSGQTVLPFNSAEQCLETLTMQDHDPACLLLDLDMPGMNGAQLLQRLAEKDRHIPTVVITGNPESRLANEARACGVQHVLEKPFDAYRLIEAIEEATLLAA